MATVAHWAAIAKGARSSGVGTTSEVGRELLESVERGLRGLKSGGECLANRRTGEFPGRQRRDPGGETVGHNCRNEGTLLRPNRGCQ
jgi:hypothetical protein